MMGVLLIAELIKIMCVSLLIGDSMPKENINGLCWFIIIGTILECILIGKIHSEDESNWNNVARRFEGQLKEKQEELEELEEKMYAKCEKIHSENSYLENKLRRLERVNDYLKEIKPKTQAEAEKYVLAYLEEQWSYPITIRRDRPINLPDSVERAWDIAQGIRPKKKSTPKKKK